MKTTPVLLSLIKTEFKQLLSALQQKHILIDTNFLIDANRNKNIFSDLIESLKKNSCTLVTINGVYHEFIKGRKSIEDYKSMFNYYQEIIDYFDPFFYLNSTTNFFPKAEAI